MASNILPDTSDMPGRKRVSFLISFLLMLWIGVSPAIAQGWSLNSQANASNVVVTFYPEAGLQPVATVRASQLFRDYQRRGFFRIGLLPIPVAENVAIRIQSAEGLTNALPALQSCNRPSAGIRGLELRNLEIGLFGEQPPRLSAALARVGQGGTLELTKVSRFNAAGQPTSIATATLQVSGASAGWLRWKVAGQPQTAFLFQSTTNKIP